MREDYFGKLCRASTCSKQGCEETVRQHDDFCPHSASYAEVTISKWLVELGCHTEVIGSRSPSIAAPHFPFNDNMPLLVDIEDIHCLVLKERQKADTRNSRIPLLRCKQATAELPKASVGGA